MILQEVLYDREEWYQSRPFIRYCCKPCNLHLQKQAALLSKPTVLDWEEKVDAIVKETFHQDMTLISGYHPVQMYLTG
ncbi:hypothetical protein CS542_05750 [Pedobacter sp. IW39]|nr:hypothetical protein CS542_05750 [Pedobacter sp. IW39]